MSACLGLHKQNKKVNPSRRVSSTENLGDAWLFSWGLFCTSHLSAPSFHSELLPEGPPGWWIWKQSVDVGVSCCHHLFPITQYSSAPLKATWFHQQHVRYLMLHIFLLAQLHALLTSYWCDTQRSYIKTLQMHFHGSQVAYNSYSNIWCEWPHSALAPVSSGRIFSVVLTPHFELSLLFS